MTADDRGGLIKSSLSEQKPRARQNVILELGMFLGKLGRDRVCAIYETGVEKPSDYDGVLYVPYDDHGAWQIKLLNELRDAGLPVDLNKLS